MSSSCYVVVQSYYSRFNVVAVFKNEAEANKCAKEQEVDRWTRAWVEKVNYYEEE